MRTNSRWNLAELALLALVALLPGCGGGDRSGSGGEPAATPAATAPPVPSDSLVLEVPGGISVWFTDARQAAAPDGSTCIERALQVRQDTTRRGVPLLYTREAPTLMDRDAIRAVLYNDCQPVAAYRVDFATISPKRLP